MITNNSQSVRKRLWIAGVAAAVIGGATVAYAVSFGSQQSTSNVKIKQIWSGRYGPTYLTFEPATLTGCYSGSGGYLSSTWSEAMADVPGQPDISSRQLATILYAKAAGESISVYYRVNSTGTGWDKCAIDAIWIE